jgi:hypothetical protein
MTKQEIPLSVLIVAAGNMVPFVARTAAVFCGRFADLVVRETEALLLFCLSPWVIIIINSHSLLPLLSIPEMVAEAVHRASS